MIRVKATYEELIAIGIGSKAAEKMAEGHLFEVTNYRVYQDRKLLFLKHFDSQSQFGLWIYEEMTEEVKWRNNSEG